MDLSSHRSTFPGLSITTIRRKEPQRSCAQVCLTWVRRWVQDMYRHSDLLCKSLCIYAQRTGVFLRRSITYQNLKGVFDSHTHTQQTKPKKNKQTEKPLAPTPSMDRWEREPCRSDCWKSNNLGTEQGLERSSPHCHSHVSPTTPHSLEWEERICFYYSHHHNQSNQSMHFCLYRRK